MGTVDGVLMSRITIKAILRKVRKRCLQLNVVTYETAVDYG